MDTCGERRKALKSYPRLVSGVGGWLDGPADDDLEPARQRLEAMRPLKTTRRGPDSFLIKTLPSGAVELVFGPSNWEFLKDRWLDHAPQGWDERLKELAQGRGSLILESQDDVWSFIESLELAASMSEGDSDDQERLDDLAKAIEDLGPLIKHS